MRVPFPSNVRRIVTLTAFAGLSLAGASVRAEDIGEVARTEARWVEATRFDLQRVPPGRAAGAASGLSRVGKVARERQSSTAVWPKDELGPRFAFEPRAGGPVVEVAALGAGKKGRPGLAHIALGWDF